MGHLDRLVHVLIFLEILLEILCWMLLENLLEIETTTVKLREIKETVEKTVGSHEGVDG